MLQPTMEPLLDRPAQIANNQDLESVLRRLAKAGCSAQYAAKLLNRIDLSGSVDTIFERALNLLISETLAAEEADRIEASKLGKRHLSFGGAWR